MKRSAQVLTTGGALILFSMPALGQGNNVLAPGGAAGGDNAERLADASAAPQPTIRKEYPVWVGYLVMFLMIAGIMGISLIPSKRSHQD